MVENLECLHRYQLDESQLKQRLRETLIPKKFPQNTSALRQAAVLLPLFCNDGDIHLLFIRRTDQVQDHKGQVSFPGGMVEPQDRDLYDTALRETWEEIGIIPQEVKILGSLPEFETVSGFIVTPIVGWIPCPYVYTPSEAEVERIFSIPLKWLIEPGNFSKKPYLRPNGEILPVIFFEPFDGETVWGITGEITVNFLKIIGN